MCLIFNMAIKSLVSRIGACGYDGTTSQQYRTINYFKLKWIIVLIYIKNITSHREDDWPSSILSKDNEKAFPLPIVVFK